MVTVEAIFDGKVFQPEEQIDWPAHARVRVMLIEEGEPTDEVPTGGFAALADWASKLPPDPTLPTDLAENHDYYKRLRLARKTAADADDEVVP